MSAPIQPDYSTLQGLSEQIGSWPDFCQALSARAPSALRPRPELAGSFEHFPAVPWFPQARIVPITERPSRTLGFVTADFYLQDPGSLLALAACQIHAGMRVCDLCAAPGGKATGIIEMLECAGEECSPPSWLLANEPIRGRLPALQFNLARSGNTRWMISQLDPGQLADRLPGDFDLVLVDAPCSGQSLVAGGKQSMSAWSEETVQHNAARQRRILAAAMKLLRPGGQLIYSTCTFAEAENEDQATWLMQNYDVAPQAIPSLMDFASHVAGCYRLWPHRHPTSGAFVASFRDRRTPCHSVRPCGSRVHSADVEREWGTLRNVILYQPSQFTRCAWPTDFPWGSLSEWDGFPGKESIFQRSTRKKQRTAGKKSVVPVFGPEIEFLTGKTWQPAYALALRNSSDWEPERRMVLDQQQSLKFCLGESFPSDAIGWSIVEYQSTGPQSTRAHCVPRSIGWGKGNGKRTRPKLPPGLLPIARECRLT
jgi:16S rRNA C967 or C1407 C5-methylase (RsmB/RsmF family)